MDDIKIKIEDGVTCSHDDIKKVLVVGCRPIAAYCEDSTGGHIVADTTDDALLANQILSYYIPELRGRLPAPRMMRCGNKKRFRKLIMSLGIPRNVSRDYADLVASLNHERDDRAWMVHWWKNLLLVMRWVDPDQVVYDF